MSNQVDKAVKVFKAVSQFPSPTSAKVLRNPNASGVNNGITIVSSWTQRNLDRKTSIKFQQTHFIETTLQKAATMLPTDITSEVLAVLSKSEDQRGVVREINVDASTKKQFLEVWQKGQLWKHYDLAALDVHGDIYHDGDFGAFEWSPCEQKLLYIAEKKRVKSEPFYKPTPQAPLESGVGDAKAKKGEEYVWRPDWGEQLTGKHQPVIGMCDVAADNVSVLDGVPAHFSPGQVLWVPGSGGGVVGVAWSNEPRRLGLVYCTNRDSSIFHLDNEGKFRVLSDENMAVRSPRFSPDGEYLVWLERPAGGVHHGAHRLVLYRWKSGTKETVTEIVRQSVATANGGMFYGIYALSLAKRCWSEDSKRIVFSTPQKCTVNTFVVNVEDKKITELECPKGSQSVLDVCNDIVVCTRSSMKNPSSLVLGRLPGRNSESDLSWKPVTNWQYATGLDSFAVHYLALTDDKDTEATCKSYNAIYFGPDNLVTKSQVPLIVWPHGGPHSVFCNDFKMEAAFMVQLGFAVLMVNYRGSIGSGQDSVEFLPGRIGDTDVSDVQNAVDEALKQFPFLDAKKMVLFGGSHGGFLVTHLSGQYPHLYQAVVARNPVIDVAAMYSVSDIPDWTAVESGLPYSECNQMSISALEKMRKCSPINYVDNVVAPTLLMVGRKDQRVPDTQSIHYYHALKANNVKTRLHSYDDCHQLGQCAVEMDNLINSALWLLEHTA